MVASVETQHHVLPYESQWRLQTCQEWFAYDDLGRSRVAGAAGCVADNDETDVFRHGRLSESMPQRRDMLSPNGAWLTGRYLFICRHG